MTRSSPGAVLARLRRERGLSQVAVARLIGMTQPSVSGAESRLGDATSVGTLRAFGTALGIDWSEWPRILSGEMPGPPDALVAAREEHGAAHPGLLERDVERLLTPLIENAPDMGPDGVLALLLCLKEHGAV